MPKEGLPDLIKEKSGLNLDQALQEQLIPSIFQQEIGILDGGSVLLLKNHNAACYRQLCKYLLDYLEDAMSKHSLNRSKISTRSQKNISCASKVSSPSVLSHDSKTSKVSEDSSKHD